MTLSLQLWNSTGTALGQLVLGNKAAEAFYGFSRGHKRAQRKNKGPTACHLMPHNKHLEGCHCQLCNNKDI
jgi:hypothetical protein